MRTSDLFDAAIEESPCRIRYAEQTLDGLNRCNVQGSAGMLPALSGILPDSFHSPRSKSRWQDASGNGQNARAPLDAAFESKRVSKKIMSSKRRGSAALQSLALEIRFETRRRFEVRQCSAAFNPGDRAVTFRV
jgi:hypothetical protein